MELRGGKRSEALRVEMRFLSARIRSRPGSLRISTLAVRRASVLGERLRESRSAAQASIVEAEESEP